MGGLADVKICELQPQKKDPLIYMLVLLEQKSFCLLSPSVSSNRL